MYNQITSNKRKSAFLIIIFIAIIFGIGYVFSQISDIGYGALVIAFIISIIMVFFSYYSGDKIALMTSEAKLVQSKTENTYLWNMVENLCITSGLPMPKIYIINDSAMNAFATGRDPEHASIAVTTGLISKLENEELEGVLAHELSHIKNYDIRLMMIVIVLVGVIALLSDFFLRFSFLGRRSNNKKTGQFGAIIIIVGLILAILSPFIAQLIKLAISRKREFLADASASLITRYPEGLASALEKISHSPALKKANKATAHLYIANPFGNTKKWFSKLYSTHPPTEERIATLREMA